MADLDHMHFIQNSLRTFLKSGHQILAHIKIVNQLRSEALKNQEDLKVEVDRLRGKATEANHLSKERAIEAEDLWEMLRKEKLTSMELRAALALEERRKKVKAKIDELKDQASK
ncbi:hypothetical protein COCNU_08G000510 [Cocos nucifera]|uniref:Uncharacterized protein n=1 Tax=Cocos nucifera TaxID=13894 RepID=A0A8K0N5Q2_COCNU|nr:hypothetical protein COCNU_08G000510 [Cocos nucifera]